MSVARLLVWSLVLALPVAANAARFEVSARGGSQLVSLSFTTTDHFPQSCWLEAKSLLLEAPEAPAEGNGESIGRIEFVTRIDGT